MSSSWDLGAITSEWYLKPLVNRQTYYWVDLSLRRPGSQPIVTLRYVLMLENGGYRVLMASNKVRVHVMVTMLP